MRSATGERALASPASIGCWLRALPAMSKSRSSEAGYPLVAPLMPKARTCSHPNCARLHSWLGIGIGRAAGQDQVEDVFEPARGDTERLESRLRASDAVDPHQLHLIADERRIGQQLRSPRQSLPEPKRYRDQHRFQSGLLGDGPQQIFVSIDSGTA